MPKGNKMPRCAIHNGTIPRGSPYIGNPSPTGMEFACVKCYEANVGSARRIRRLSKAEQNGILRDIARGVGKGAVGAARIIGKGAVGAAKLTAR